MTLRKLRGYTLIEVMIALMVFAIIATISSSVMYHVFDIRQRVAKQAEQLDQLQLVMTIFEHDMTQLISRTVHANDMREFASFIGTYQYMEFTRGGQVNPKAVVKRSGLKRIAYLCNSEQLIRRSWDVVDTTDRHRYEDKILLDHVENCSFSYVSSYQQMMPEWNAYSVGQNQKIQILPSGIQLTINPYHWGKMTFLFVIPEGLYAF